jgi:hypothetical protein
VNIYFSVYPRYSKVIISQIKPFTVCLYTQFIYTRSWTKTPKLNFIKSENNNFLVIYHSNSISVQTTMILLVLWLYSFFSITNITVHQTWFYFKYKLTKQLPPSLSIRFNNWKIAQVTMSACECTYVLLWIFSISIHTELYLSSNLSETFGLLSFCQNISTMVTVFECIQCLKVFTPPDLFNVLLCYSLNLKCIKLRLCHWPSHNIP